MHLYTQSFLQLPSQLSYLFKTYSLISSHQTTLVYMYFLKLLLLYYCFMFTPCMYIVLTHYRPMDIWHAVRIGADWSCSP